MVATVLSSAVPFGLLGCWVLYMVMRLRRRSARERAARLPVLPTAVVPLGHPERQPDPLNPRELRTLADLELDYLGRPDRSIS